MSFLKIYTLMGVLFAVWTGTVYAQSSSFANQQKADAELQSFYEKVLESAPDMPKNQRMALELKIKNLKFKQALTSEQQPQLAEEQEIDYDSDYVLEQ